ncbi:helix-turn-helix transcriptional regulator [Chryseobacterium sp. WG14]|uniref:AraC family transcriptional regulator n=2 Tax=Chryseobacterium TaxID=59732 RepID=UPI00211F1987|nr:MULTISPECIES: helix-turn-helix transcriptional regulator [unclassified Chryseobacterium]MCQ9635586.1 helix-turn-helix transcriptional regulator [Chryseobacterium sp. WG23]MCQ9638540.1 helix-turn-helix transcriptional regulator [Chryseobacterium sp. WG14]
MNSISVLHIDLFQAGRNTSDFYFNTMKNHLVVGHRHIEKPHRHDFYAAVLFTGGTGFHEIDFQKYEVSEGSLFFLSPGQIHSWELSADIEGYIFFCSQEFYEMHYVNQKLRNFPFFGSVSFPRKLQLDTLELKQNIHLFQELEKEYQGKNIMKEGLMLSLMSQIFINATRLFSKDFSRLDSSAGLSYFKHYQDFENLIEEHFPDEKSIAYYASLLNISPKHLNRIAQTVVQKTATDVITERVVLEAKRMLMYLDESLVEVAFRLGYEEYSYFVRVFRKNSGMTPTQFIKEYKV